MRAKAPIAKKFLEFAFVAFIVFCLTLPLHNLVSSWLGRRESVSFYIAMIGAPAGVGIGIMGAAIFAIAERCGKQGQAERERRAQAGQS